MRKKPTPDSTDPINNKTDLQFLTYLQANLNLCVGQIHVTIHETRTIATQFLIRTMRSYDVGL